MKSARHAMRLCRSATLVAVVFALGGCASSVRHEGWSIVEEPRRSEQPQAPPPRPESSRWFDAPFDKVWSAAIGALADENVPIQVSEKESGVVATQFVRFGEDYDTEETIRTFAYPPDGAVFSTTSSMARYSLSILVTKDTDSTTVVKVTPRIEAFDVSWHVCESNGVLERRLLSAIAKRL